MKEYGLRMLVKVIENVCPAGITLPRLVTVKMLPVREQPTLVLEPLYVIEQVELGKGCVCEGKVTTILASA